MKQITFGLFYLLLLAPTVFAAQKNELFLSAKSEASVKVSNFAKNMHSAWREKKPWPLISTQISNVTELQAAKAQFLFVQKVIRSERISGFKAGLTSKVGQKKFNVDAPVSGTLFKKGQVSKNEKLRLSDYRKLMLETEIGFILAKNIQSPVADIQHLKSYVKSVVPAIEMPNLAFEDLKNLTGHDIVASNAAANRYLLGAEIALPVKFSLDEVKIKLSINSIKESKIVNQETVVNQGTGSDAMGSQWQALLWLVNERLAAGYHLQKGQFLITGALGKMIPAQVGHYHANFGALGDIRFTILE